MPVQQLQFIGLKVLLLQQNVQAARIFSTVNSNIPVIKFPISVRKRLIYKEKVKLKGNSSISLKLARPGKLMISGSKKSYSMYTDEFCNKFNPPVLASSSWTSRRSPGRHFTIHPIKKNPSLKATTTFEELHLSKEILEALRMNDIENPTVIQSKTIPPILNGDNVMLAAETGCGKTLSYLLPILQKLMKLKEKENSSVPRVLILTPTQELVQQVVAMGSRLNLPIQYLSLFSTQVMKNIKSYSKYDVIVSTPSLTLKAISSRKLNFTDFEFIVLDECDTLLDDSFSSSVTEILRHFNLNKGLMKPVLNGHSVQLILSSATYPKYAKEALEDIIADENILSVRSGYLHRISPHVMHKFLRVRPSEKVEQTARLIENRVPTIVFCNFQKTALQLHRSLQEQALPSVLIDSALSNQERSRRMNELINGDHNLVVATDLLSRGMDTKQIEHVINYEVPGTVADYLHRCGRVGRVGQTNTCTVTTLVSRKWEIDVIKQIEEAARRREEINTVSANIKQRHNQRWEDDNQLLFE